MLFRSVGFRLFDKGLRLLQLVFDAVIDQQSTTDLRLYLCCGSHAWEIDGLAFFLLDRLLKPGGYMDFDDYGWSMAASPALNPTACPEILSWFTDEQIKTSHIMLIVELLVKRDSRYHEVVSNKIFRKASA